MSSLNVIQNRQKQEITEAKALAARYVLNPDFPYTVVAFDPAAFGLNRAPEIDTTETATT